MPVLDAFGADNFTTLSMTDAINKIPFVPGRAGALGLFEEFGVSTTTIFLEERDGVLSLIQTTARGAPAVQHSSNDRVARSLVIPHIALEDQIQASELQDVREFGSEGNHIGVQTEVDRKVAEMAMSVDATLENLRIGAIKGTILDADGTTVIANLFTEFGVTQLATVDFDFSVASVGDIRTDCHGIIRDMEDEMPNLVYDHVHSFCGDLFFDELVAHAEVREAYARWVDNGQAGEFLRQSLARRAFPYAGVMFENYRGSVGGTKFVADGDAHFFPVGVTGLFRNPFAPADFAETVGTLGLPRYAKQAVDQRFQRFVDVHVQSNPLPYCTRPKVLRLGTNT